jgi:hypothetical protein
VVANIRGWLSVVAGGLNIGDDRYDLSKPATLRGLSSALLRAPTDSRADTSARGRRAVGGALAAKQETTRRMNCARWRRGGADQFLLP